MVSFLAQFLAVIVAGFALFRLWRANRSSDRWINIVIVVGFLARAVVGQLLFWISYARLPVARSLQMGDGFWFFASDAAIEYFPTASLLARTGVRAIIEYPTTGASVAFVKVLATAVLLFGAVASVAVLLNLFCYLGMTAIIVRWSEREPRARLAAAFAICAISLSPAFFLWSLQPLKDTFFQFIVIAFIGSCAAWQRTWIESPVRLPVVLLTGSAMIVTLLAIAGVRWYFAFALFAATIIFLLLIASMFRGRKAIAFGASAVMVVLLSRAFLFGGGAYVPMTIVRTLSPSTAMAEVTGLPSSILTRIESTRDGFEKVGGRTSIHLGGSMSKLDHALSASTEDQRAANDSDAPGHSPTSKEEMDVKQRMNLPQEQAKNVSIASAEELGKTAEASPPHVAAPVAPSAPAEVASAKTSETVKPVQPHPNASLPKQPPTEEMGKTAEAPPPQVAAWVAPSVPAEVASAKTNETVQPVQPHPNASLPKQPPTVERSAPVARIATNIKSTSEVRSATGKAGKEQPTRRSRVSSKPIAVPTNTVPAQTVSQPPEKAENPVSITTRLLTGGASVVIPRSIGERMGIFHIGGGQGMFWFTEIDTIIFDLTLACAIFALAVGRSVSWRNPLVWLLGLITVLAGVPLGYVITNYGTLFRLREMIYIGLALIPLALATSTRRNIVAASDAPPAS